MKVSQLFETINSLMGVNKFHNITWKELTALLEYEYGIEVVGSGSFGTVFWHPSWNFVYKIFEEDTGYMQFVEYAMKHPHNPHLPKILRAPRQIHAFHMRHHQTSPKLWAVKIEKLDGVVGEARAFLNDGRVWFATRRFVANQLDPNDDDMSIRGHPVDSSQHLEDVFNKFQQFDLRGIVTTLADLADECDISPFDFDLHDQNFMMRGNDIVIIDPMVNDEDKQAFFRAATRYDMMKRGPDYKNKPELIFNT